MKNRKEEFLKDVEKLLEIKKITDKRGDDLNRLFPKSFTTDDEMYKLSDMVLYFFNQKWSNGCEDDWSLVDCWYLEYYGEEKKDNTPDIIMADGTELMLRTPEDLYVAYLTFFWNGTNE